MVVSIERLAERLWHPGIYLEFSLDAEPLHECNML